MFEENYKRLSKIVNECLQTMFSSIHLRIYCARKYNPDVCKRVTLVIDGHDSRINYVDTDIKKKRLYSYKFKNKGIRTQIVTDINDMTLYTHI